MKIGVGQAKDEFTHRRRRARTPARQRSPGRLLVNSRGAAVEEKSRSIRCGVCVPGAGGSDVAGTVFRHGEFSCRPIPLAGSRLCVGGHQGGSRSGWPSGYVVVFHAGHIIPSVCWSRLADDDDLKPDIRRERVAYEGLCAPRSVLSDLTPAYERRRGAPEEAQTP